MWCLRAFQWPQRLEIFSDFPNPDHPWDSLEIPWDWLRSLVQLACRFPQNLRFTLWTRVVPQQRAHLSLGRSCPQPLRGQGRGGAGAAVGSWGLAMEPDGTRRSASRTTAFIPGLTAAEKKHGRNMSLTAAGSCFFRISLRVEPHTMPENCGYNRLHTRGWRLWSHLAWWCWC